MEVYHVQGPLDAALAIQSDVLNQLLPSNPAFEFLRGVSEDVEPPFDATPKSPKLPTELWEKIVEFATYIPGVYDTEDYAAIAAFTREHYGISINNRFNEAIHTKLALSRVSRYWNTLIQRFLFQYIRIKTGQQACATASALRGISKGANPIYGPGRWTLRVEIALDGIHEWTQVHINAMLHIFKSCPNLICFSTMFATADPYVYSCTTLINGLSKNHHLKRLELKFDSEVLESVMESLGHSVQVLWLYPCRRITRHRVIGDYLLPKLRMLISSESMSPWPCVTGLTAPNLRACIIDHPFGLCFLPNMDKTQIEYLSTSNVINIASELDSWPNLATLSATYFELATQPIIWPTMSIQSQLECIMIEDLSGQLHTHLQGNLFQLISPSLFPNLKCAKLSLPPEDRNGSFPILPNSVKRIWHPWLKMCKLYGIRIEVSQGVYEWTADYWQEVAHDEVYELLFNTPEELEPSFLR